MGMDDRQVELLWEELVQHIEKGRVVPVVGQDLLVLEPPGSPPVLLYRHLANLVAPRLGLAPPPKTTPNPLNALACEFVKGTREQKELHTRLREAMAEIQEHGWIPEPLLQLAGISDFQLFVTTTIDPFLASALNRVRFSDQQRTEVFAFSLYGADDLPPHSAVTTPTVFHLLGQLQIAPQYYAVTEEDTLEFVHALQAEARRPARLFEELDRKHLLILGSGFSDWLARFFIRTAKSQRLWPARDPSDFVADSAIARQQSLAEFLHYRSSTQLFDMDGVAFVAELYHRWTERKKRAAVPEKRTELPPMRRGAIFISYASEDREAARSLAQRLQQANLEVWFDRIELKPGDPGKTKFC